MTGMDDAPDAGTGSCPFAELADPDAHGDFRHALRRRSFLRGAAVGAVGAAAVTAGGFGVAQAVSSSGSSGTGSGRTIGFHGAHQAGILTPPQLAGTFVSFNVIAADRPALQQMFRTLTQRARFLTAGGTPVDLGVASPPSDSSTIGPVVVPDGLTITVGVGASLFDGRYGLAARKPAKLAPMPAFPNDNMVDSTEMHGDLSIQICADNRDTVMHALRDIAKHTRQWLQPNWKADGFQSPSRPTGAQRNQLGFKDGIANPDVDSAAETAALIWTHGGANGEPGWTEGGSYQVIRIIRMLVEFWDRVSLTEQENMFGRRRDSGAPLSGGKETDIPLYANDPDGKIIPLDAHIRLANPRTAKTDRQRILRRGYNYDRGVDANGNLDVGLLFACYNQDVVRQFEAVQTRLIDEPLVDYISPTGGGYFFALPGVKDASDYYASGLFA
ncbi:MAG TPA: iron uptake transporter deferrochelatase/peroxidase subunit [Actinocrinis sp.]|uniref:iron uptake transporter deferrochelatase/peroxidase subunit n=1 Tax=Actinocrinis sp. TaxID=1920516 RepID=UPI002DDD1836|nr:iron uptake transporter deferrochelatase/peroxidase subunit [Actinocrinis sp.]HEV2346825.1 iron uptake transporter deferrochelatase/peroxidase subunit [Actinocrinis sp.]